MTSPYEGLTGPGASSGYVTGPPADPLDTVITTAPKTIPANPALAAALASVGADEPTVELTAAAAYAKGWKQTLEGLPDDWAKRFWDKMDPQQQALVAAGGYRPPEGDGGGWFSAVKGFVSSAVKTDLGWLSKAAPDVIEDPLVTDVKTVGGAIGTAYTETGHAIGEGLGALAVPSNYVTHAYRTAEEIAGPSGWDFSLSPGDWRRAWRKTEHGERYFDQGRLGAAKSRYDPLVFAFAKRIAEGEQVPDLVTEFPTDQRGDAFVLMHSTEFLDAVQEVDAAHVSPGRQLAATLGIDASNPVYDEVSGSWDAVVRVTTDPLLLLGKAKRATDAVAWGIDSAAGTRRVDQLFGVADDGTGVGRWLDDGEVGRKQLAVRRYWDRATDEIAVITSETASAEAQAAAAASLRQSYPDAYRMAKGLTDNKVTSAQAAAGFLKGQTGFLNLLQGRAALGRPLMPRMSRFGESIVNSRERIGAPINWLEDGGRFVTDEQVGPVWDEQRGRLLTPDEQLGRQIHDWRFSFRARAANTLTRFAERVPITQGGRIDLEAADAHEQVRRYARMFMPSWYANEAQAAFLTADLAGKQRIIHGIAQSLGEAAGVTQTAAGRRWWSQFTSGLYDEGTSMTRFSDKGRDLLPDGTAGAIRSDQIRTHVHLPGFRELHSQSGKAKVMERVVGRIDNSFFDYATDRIFKPAVLIRPALPFRNALEEQLNFVVREGLVPLLKGGRLRKELDPQSGRFFRALTNGLTVPTLRPVIGKEGQQIVAGKLETAKDWVNARTFQNFQRLIPGYKVTADDIRYMDEGMAQPIFRNTMFRTLVESQQAAVRMSEEGVVIEKVRNRGGSARHTALVKTGNFDAKTAAGLDGAERWAYQLRAWAEIPEGQIVMPSIIARRPREQVIDEVADWIETGNGQALKDTVKGYQTWGARGLAERMYDDAFDYVATRDGVLNDDVLRLLDNGQGGVTADKITVDALNEIDDLRRPANVVGQEVVHLQTLGQFVGKAVDWGFDVLGDYTSFLSRQRIYPYHYIKARKEAAAFERELTGRIGEVEARKIMVKHASETALHRTLAYVDNPEVRSQMAVIMRNLFPFWRAQEEFYRRWANTAVHSPLAMRRLSLINEGLHHSGFVFKDDQGNDTFVYPGSGHVYGVLAAVGDKFGVDLAKLPINYELQSQVRFLNQGLDPKNVLPSGGPLLGAPLWALAQAFPGTWIPVNRVILGEQGAEANPIEQFIPTILRRMYRAGYSPLPGTGETDDLHSAMIQAIKYAEYLGKTPPDDANEEQIDEYQALIKSMSRELLGLRAAFGFFLPAAPMQGGLDPTIAGDIQADGLRSISDEYFALVERLGSDEAYAVFKQQYGDDASPFTLSATKGRPGSIAPPATQKVLDYIKGNQGFVDANKRVAAYWAPLAWDEYDPNAFQVELAEDLRRRKGPREFYDEMKSAAHLGDYFDARDAWEKAHAEASADPNATVEWIDEGWSQWKEGFFNSHPLVRKYLAEGATRQEEREATVTSLRRALNSPEVPKGPTTGLFSEILEAWDAHTLFQQQHAGSDTASEQARSAERGGFDAWLVGRIGDNPNGLALYNKVFRYLEES